MTPTGWIIFALSILIGIVVGTFLYKHFPHLLGKDKKMQKVIRDPHLLVEKLKSHGKIYDDGKELDIKVGIDNETGQEVVVIEEKETKKSKQIQKKIKKDKAQTKKEVKKKIAFIGKDPGKRKKK